MGLRPRRRNLVIWSSSGGPAHRYGSPQYRRFARTGHIRRLVRIGALVTVIAVRPRWRPLLAGMVLLGVGVMERGGVGSIVLIPGLMFLWNAVLIPGDADIDRDRRSQLARELAAYSTPAQRCDLEAILDRYPDGITGEMRDILASQAMAARGSGIPGAPRF
jgi:hypothetical protein